MKLLFDENLSPKLPRLLATLFPGSAHPRECGLLGGSDEDAWEYARAHGFTIVSKDSDFYQRSLIHGYPPKLIWRALVTVPDNSSSKSSQRTNRIFTRSMQTRSSRFLSSPRN